MKILTSIFLVVSLLFLFACNALEHNEQDNSNSITKEEVVQLPKTVQDEHISLRLIESGEEFPIPFVTYIPSTFATYHSQSEGGNIILFKYKNQATISFTVLPQEEFSKKKLGEAYVKELLGRIADDVKLQPDGFYRGKSLGRYQNAKVGVRNGYVYYWLLDSSFELKDELLSAQSILFDRFQWVNYGE